METETRQIHVLDQVSDEEVIEQIMSVPPHYVALNGVAFYMGVGFMSPPMPAPGPAEGVPGALVQSAGATGANGGRREYQIVATNIKGQDTPPSATIVADYNPATNVSNKLYWAPVPGATSYKILLKTILPAGTYSPPILISVIGQTAAWDSTYPSLCSYTDTLTAAQLVTLQSGGGAITSATNATPIQITSSGHGLVTGQTVVVSGVTVNTAANGTWTITKVDANNFTLNGSVGNGVGTNGTWVAAVYVPALIMPELQLPFDTVYAPVTF
jgi:hypothetical protein